MSERIPKAIANIDSEPVPKTMGEAETVAFLEERGIEALEEWEPGTPLLYVLHTRMRAGFGPFTSVEEDKIPSIARIDSPTYLDPDDTLGIDARAWHALGNNGGQIDYYAIDRDTKIPYLVKTSSKITTPQMPYAVQRNLLYTPDDLLFPKSEPISPD